MSRRLRRKYLQAVGYEVHQDVGDRRAWREFAYDLRNFVRRMDEPSANAMQATEFQEAEVKGHDLAVLHVSEKAKIELKNLLINFTELEAKEIVQGADDETGIEIWRLLLKEVYPTTGTAQMNAIHRLTNPSPTKCYLDYKNALKSWDNLMEEEKRLGVRSWSFLPACLRAVSSRWPRQT